MRPPINTTRTVTRFAWFPLFVDDRERLFDVAWLTTVRVTERYADAPPRPELYGEPLFFPEPRWRRVRVERCDGSELG